MRLLSAVIRRSVAHGAILAIVAMALWATAVVVTAAAPSPARLTLEGVKGCVQATQARSAHFLTLAEARVCAPGAPELQAGDTWKLSGAVIVKGAKIHLYFTETQAGSGPAAGPALVAALRPLGPVASCWNDWHWQQIYYTDGSIWGTTSGWGYGDHCGYANASYPSTGWQCFTCSSVGLNQGSYDNNFGMANYGQNSAAGWANIYPYFFPFGSDSFFNRLYWDPWGNYWVQGW